MSLQANNIEKKFKTPLGIIRVGIISAGIKNALEVKKYDNGNSEIINTNGHKIELVSFKVRIPLYNGDSLTDSSGWIFRIEKITEANDETEIYCLLDKISDEVSFDSASGESLDAVQAESNEWILHIGTEDGETLNSRAENDDWFPPGLKNSVGLHQSITEMKQNGFITKIPNLNKGEKLHIQYVTAYDRNDKQKVNTWLAVDESKRNLENWIGIW